VRTALLGDGPRCDRSADFLPVSTKSAYLISFIIRPE